MTEIKTNGHTIIVVPVPEDSYRFSLVKNKHLEKRYGRLEYTERGNGIEHTLAIAGIENYEILGEITPSEISFDVSPYVEKIHVEEAPSPFNDMAGGWHYAFVDYENIGEFAGYNGDAGCFNDPHQSFRSLLAAKGVIFESEIKEPNHLHYKHKKYKGELTFISDHYKTMYSNAYDKWLSKVISKCVILLKKRCKK